MTLELDLSDLWTSPLADEAVRRFEVAWANAIIGERTPTPGPERRQAYWALKTDAKAAWSRGDIKTVAGIGAVLHRANNLNDQSRRQAASALLAVGRYPDAREVLTASTGVDPDYWYDTARALAGQGRLPEALKAIQAAAARPDTPPPDAELAQTIGEYGRRPSDLDLALGWRAAHKQMRISLKSGRPDEAAGRYMRFRQTRAPAFRALIEAAQAAAGATPTDWSALRDAAVAWLLFGRGHSAGELLLGAAMVRPRTPADVAEALRIAGAAAAALPPERLPLLLRWARALVESDPERRFLDAALAALADPGAWKGVVAAAPPDALQLIAFVATVLGAAERPQAPIALFGRLAEVRKKPQAALRELAFCSGLESSSRIELRAPPRVGSPRVFDLFPYNGEIEALKIKLHEMAPWVERFVIVEAAESYSGAPRPIQLPSQQAEIAEFLPKISHVVVDKFPDFATTPWARAHHQRDEAVAALKDLCGPDDLVLVSDVDEVVDRRALAGFSGLCAVLKTDLFRYFLNYRSAQAGSADRGEPVMLRARHLRTYSPSVARALLPGPLESNRLEGAGWRFTDVGQADAGDPELARRVKAGELEPGWEKSAVEALPAYVRENRERLAPLIL